MPRPLLVDDRDWPPEPYGPVKQAKPPQRPEKKKPKGKHKPKGK
jgi:hypothetical protein